MKTKLLYPACLLLVCFVAAASGQAQMLADIGMDVSTSFGTYHPYPAVFTPKAPTPQVKSDFSNVQYLPPGISPVDSALLFNNHFVVRKSPHTQIYDLYNKCTQDGTPVFVTADAVLHTYHVLFDRFLRDLETARFFGKVNRLTDALLDGTQAQNSKTAKPLVREALKSNLAYFSVAKKLLQGETAVIPDSLRAAVDAEIALITQHAGYSYSPVLGEFTQLDYSQFQVRGHYTRSDTLTAYFKAMMWYGWTIFAMEPDLFGELALRHTLQALSMVQLLFIAQAGGEPLDALWQSLYEPTVFFVGKTDDPNVFDYKRIAEEVYGEHFLKLLPDSLADETLLARFMTQAQTLPEPKIPNWIYGSFSRYKGFRLMGQRFIPDSWMFTRLVMPAVDGRVFPKGLDVMAVLGSERADTLLDSVYQQTNYPGYAAQIDALKQEFAGKAAEEWAQNLYWNWLYCLMPLLYQKGEGYPFFMQRAAWSDKELLTALASWAELRHDTILYAKQSVTPKNGGAMLPRSYVEPNPHLYARLASLVRYTREGLDNLDLLLPKFREPVELFENYLILLRDISIKELETIPLAESDYQNIFSFGRILESLVTDPHDAQNGKDKMAIIADVHTDMNTSQCLEEGVGYPLDIWVIVEEGGMIRLTRGAIYSYYEFTQPIGNRLTDEAWQELLVKTPPDRPEWMGSMMDLHATQPAVPEVSPQNLYGNKFVTGVLADDCAADSPRGYALAQNYPNPFNPVTMIPVDLAAKSHVLICVYNLAGQTIATLHDGELAAGKHTLKWDGRNAKGEPVASGVYLCKIVARDFSSRDQDEPDAIGAMKYRQPKPPGWRYFMSSSRQTPNHISF